MTSNQENFLSLIQNNKVCVMVAPSFVIGFKYPAIIGMLKKLGVSMVTELTFGAKMTNVHYADYVKSNPTQKYYIASPCPVVVSMIKTQYKELVQYLMPVCSPMGCQAKILNKLYPEYKLVFISPCRAKQNIEVKEYKDIIAESLTFKEIKELFDVNNIKEDDYLNCNEVFNSVIESSTKIYPISGGLACSANLKDIFKEEEILIDDGITNVKNVLNEIKNNTTKYKFFDLLNCDGGCIGGAEIDSQLSKDEKKQKILDYKLQMEKNTISHNDHSGDVDGIDFSRKFE